MDHCSFKLLWNTFLDSHRHLTHTCWPHERPALFIRSVGWINSRWFESKTVLIIIHPHKDAHTPTHTHTHLPVFQFFEPQEASVCVRVWVCKKHSNEPSLSEFCVDILLLLKPCLIRLEAIPWHFEFQCFQQGSVTKATVLLGEQQDTSQNFFPTKFKISSNYFKCSWAWLLSAFSASIIPYWSESLEFDNLLLPTNAFGR